MVYGIGVVGVFTEWLPRYELWRLRGVAEGLDQSVSTQWCQELGVLKPHTNGLNVPHSAQVPYMEPGRESGVIVMAALRTGSLAATFAWALKL